MGADEWHLHAFVKAALRARNEHWESHYEATSKLAARIAGLGLILSMAVAAVVLLAHAGFTFLGEGRDEGGALTAGVVLFGVIGGAITSILTATASRKTLPEQARDDPWHYITTFHVR